jgi:hypothetical protein
MQHQLRTVAHVRAILKLAKLLGQMFRARMNVRAVDAALEHGPEPSRRFNVCPLEPTVVAERLRPQHVSVAPRPAVHIALASELHASQKESHGW